MDDVQNNVLKQWLQVWQWMSSASYHLPSKKYDTHQQSVWLKSVMYELWQTESNLAMWSLKGKQLSTGLNCV
jgi:hypothetical protein